MSPTAAAAQPTHVATAKATLDSADSGSPTSNKVGCSARAAATGSNPAANGISITPTIVPATAAHLMHDATPLPEDEQHDHHTAQGYRGDAISRKAVHPTVRRFPAVCTG